MKKLFVSLCGYLLFAFCVCYAVSGCMDVPPVLEGQRISYLFFRGVSFFLRLLPALFCSSFMVALSIYFGQHTGNAGERFSPAIFRHFKMVMITSLGMAFCLALSSEIFLPVIYARQQLAEEAPSLLSEYLISGRYCYVIKNYYLAHEYGRHALKLSPGNKDAQALVDDSERSLHSMKARQKVAEVQVNPDLSWNELQSETVTSLLEKAQKAYNAARWFDAHYYAELALITGDGKDINLNDAKRLSSESWNRLNESAPLTDYTMKKIFDKKKKAYSYLISGDNLEAYYEFLELYNEEGIFVDPDVKNYYEIAKDRLTREAFFIDETLHLQLFEFAQNVYFTIPHPSGGKDVVFIKGITSVSNSGRRIQYLRDFSLYSYSADGHFIRSLSTPYAKLVAEPISLLDETEASLDEIAPSSKTVPYIILKSVSREPLRVKNEPTYNFAADIPETDRATPSYLFMPIPFEDFNLICDAAVGPKNMSLLSLIKMVGRAKDFGYSDEVFGATLIRRMSYPLLMLVLFIFCASFAWNYRIKKHQLFKFSWIFILPVCTIVLYVAVEILLYVSELLCYALVGFSGWFSILSAMLIHIVMLIAVSVLFLARNSHV